MYAVFHTSKKVKLYVVYSSGTMFSSPIKIRLLGQSVLAFSNSRIFYFGHSPSHRQMGQARRRTSHYLRTCVKAATAGKASSWNRLNTKTENKKGGECGSGSRLRVSDTKRDCKYVNSNDLLTCLTFPKNQEKAGSCEAALCYGLSAVQSLWLL